MPDFSKLNFDETDNASALTRKSVALNEKELANSLLAFINSGDKLGGKFYSKIPTLNESVYLPAMSYCSMFESFAPFDANMENLFAGLFLDNSATF